MNSILKIIEGFFEQRLLEEIGALMTQVAMNKDYRARSNSLGIPNEDILGIFLKISIERELDESDNIELLEELNALNEIYLKVE